jgi:hypothetical protein
MGDHSTTFDFQIKCIKNQIKRFYFRKIHFLSLLKVRGSNSQMTRSIFCGIHIHCGNRSISGVLKADNKITATFPPDESDFFSKFKNSKIKLACTLTVSGWLDSNGSVGSQNSRAIRGRSMEKDNRIERRGRRLLWEQS